MADYYTAMTVAPSIPSDLLSEDNLEFLSTYGIYPADDIDGLIYLSAEEYNPEGWPLDGDEANTEDDLEAFFQALVGMSDGRVPWVSFELAYTCSKMRPEAFGGAAVFITADDVKHISTAGWLAEQVEALKS